MRKADTQLCWACANSVNKGCSWSKSFIPVEGWEAETVENICCGTTYKILTCPEFKPDDACDSCKHNMGSRHCIDCLYFTMSGKGSKIKWEGGLSANGCNFRMPV